MRSTSLKGKERLDMGLQFERFSLFRGGFLRSGVIVDCLMQDGKQPVDYDRLTMLVSVSAKTGKHFFKRDVGIGSRSHCLSGKWLMRRQISTTVAGRKDASGGGVFGGHTW